MTGADEGKLDTAYSSQQVPKLNIVQKVSATPSVLEEHSVGVAMATEVKDVGPFDQPPAEIIGGSDVKSHLKGAAGIAKHAKQCLPLPLRIQGGNRFSPLVDQRVRKED
jgi:hypothetical protein